MIGEFVLSVKVVVWPMIRKLTFIYAITVGRSISLKFIGIEKGKVGMNIQN